MGPCGVAKSGYGVAWWRRLGRRTCEREVAGSSPGRALLRSNLRQVVDTHVPRR